MNKSNPEILIGGKQVGFCYIIAEGGHQKIGKSLNVDGVLAQARRFDSSARLLTCWPSPFYHETEALVHDGLKKWRMEGEQFNLPNDALKWICSLCDREFAEWVWEADCDERAIGWVFPRVHEHRGVRLWPCVYFPKNDTVAWGMFAYNTKPDYSTLEKAWLQDSRGWNSVWLGRPQRHGGPRSINAVPMGTNEGGPPP